MKVNAILNQIDGKTRLGNKSTRTPTLFGMNFQAVSAVEKFIESGFGDGGYTNATGTPTGNLLSKMQFVDASIGEMIPTSAIAACSPPPSSSSPPSMASRPSTPTSAKPSPARLKTASRPRPHYFSGRQPCTAY